MYSAVKVKGERLYKAARRGESVERKARPITVHSFEVSRDEGNARDVHFKVSCSKGTYIRSLAHDLVSPLPLPVAKWHAKGRRRPLQNVVQARLSKYRGTA
jgi:tRNA pseudouridine(55) synthase